MRARLFVLSTLTLLGCSEAAEQRAAQLDEALAGTRQPRGDSQTRPHTLPLDDAEPHHLRMSGTFVLREVGKSSGRSVQLSREVYRGKGGRYRIEEIRSWSDPVVAPEGREDGRTIVFDGERLAVRRSWGPWMEREIVGGQQTRLLAQAHDIGTSVLEAFAPYMRFSKDAEGDKTLAGMNVRWERVSLDHSVSPKPLDPKALSALREHTEDWTTWLAATHKPSRIEGRIARRLEGDRALIAGRLDLEGTAQRGAERRDFLLLLNYEIAPLPPAISFDLPETMTPARRDRPWKMVKEALGEDLLAPYKP